MSTTSKSACYNAEMRVENGGDREGTHWHVCQKCGQPCDAAPASAETPAKVDHAAELREWANALLATNGVPRLIADIRAAADELEAEKLRADLNLDHCRRVEAANARLNNKIENLLKPMRDAAIERAERAEAERDKLVGFYNEILMEFGHDRVVTAYRERGELLSQEANRRKDAEAELAAVKKERDAARRAGQALYDADAGEIQDAMAQWEAIALCPNHHNTLEKAVEGVTAVVDSLRADLANPPADVRASILNDAGLYEKAALIETQAAQIAELEKDKERLDWLALNMRQATLRGFQQYITPECCIKPREQGVRSAIDSARAPRNDLT
jgi:hypothetical protein